MAPATNTPAYAVRDVSYYATRGKHSPLIPQIVQPGRAFMGSVAFRF